jgi:Membrane transporters of cations and cationic drugs
LSCLALTPQVGIGLGVAFGIWAALGVALTAVASRILFKEPLNWAMATGVAPIMGGVLFVEAAGVH